MDKHAAKLHGYSSSREIVKIYLVSKFSFSPRMSFHAHNNHYGVLVRCLPLKQRAIASCRRPEGTEASFQRENRTRTVSLRGPVPVIVNTCSVFSRKGNRIEFTLTYKQSFQRILITHRAPARVRTNVVLGVISYLPWNNMFAYKAYTAMVFMRPLPTRLTASNSIRETFQDVITVRGEIRNGKYFIYSAWNSRE